MTTLRLEYPFLALTNRCATLCVPECCGIDAYDFSHIHVASFLIQDGGSIDKKLVIKLKGQIMSMRSKFDVGDAKVTVNDLNQHFTGVEFAKLLDEIASSIDRAVVLLRAEGLA